MDLLPLDSSFNPAGSVFENYSSLIWSERYSTTGDFELKSSDIATCVKALPRESFVSLRDSLVPMVVEDHKIVKTPKGPPSIVITGRTFESVLERRASVKDALPLTSVRTPWLVPALKESDAAFEILRTVLGDVAQYKDGTLILSAVSPAVSALDAIPEISLVLPADYSLDDTNKYAVKTQDLLKTVLELIQTNRRGIKSVRPLENSSHPGKVAVEIYNGADLTSILSFDARFDQFDSATYYLSARGSANVGYIYGTNGAEKILKTAAPEPSGLNRRVLAIDQSSDSSTGTADARRSRALVELYKNNVTALFDGEIAAQVAQGYNSSYYLGDILKLVGEYGLSASVRVAEYIRSSDATGEKAFPTFETIAVE